MLAALTFVQPPPGWTLDAESHTWNKDASSDSEQFSALQDAGSKLTSRQYAESTIQVLKNVRTNYQLVSHEGKTVCGVLGYEVVATFEIDVEPWTEESIYVSTPTASFLTSYLRPTSHPEDPDAIKSLNSLCPPPVKHK